MLVYQRVTLVDTWAINHRERCFWTQPSWWGSAFCNTWLKRLSDERSTSEQRKTAGRGTLELFPTLFFGGGEGEHVRNSIWISNWVLVPNPKWFTKFSFITWDLFFWMVELILGKFSIHTRCFLTPADLAELKRPVESPSHESSW